LLVTHLHHLATPMTKLLRCIYLFIDVDCSCLSRRG